jgi:hydroxymethylbilane synthase
MHLKIAARSSDLARWQAVQVGTRLKEKFPHINIEYFFRSSFGDQNLDLPLAQMESKGVFTQDFYQDLKRGEFDMVVHSWKDLPTEEREGTMIVATLERADVRDILLIPKTLWAQAKKSKNLKLLTSSPRRLYNLKPWLPKALPQFQDGKVEFLPVRGNIPSRLDKMFSQEAGLIMAKAAFDRMLSGGPGFEEVGLRTREKFGQCLFMVLPLEINPTAPAQGALAIEIAENREDLKEILSQINDTETFQNVEMEREILKSYGGGCHQKIGVSRVVKPFGVYHVEKGESDFGTKLSRHELLKYGPPKNFKGLTQNEIFPLTPKENSWFEREPISFDGTRLSGRAVLVARVAEGVPSLTEAAQVWTAGVTSWEKLAQKGVWVNGCLESLGEQEIKWLGAVTQDLQWIKLSHDGTTAAALETSPYYHLKEKNPAPDLTGKKVFFWMSFSAFERALALFPQEIASGFHACGPGGTHEKLKNHSALKEPPQVFLNLEEFHTYLRQNGVRF